MPLIYLKEVSAGIAGVWHILESEADLLGLAEPGAEDREILSTYRNESRRKQWLACRALLGTMLKSTPVKIVYDGNGKPVLKGAEGEISFSHTPEYAAVMLGYSRPVGIDIEKVKPRIERVSSRFLNPAELEHIENTSNPLISKHPGDLTGGDGTTVTRPGNADEEIHDRRLKVLYVYWCSKEALYKFYGKPAVDLKNDIHIRPFDYFCKLQGSLTALLTSPEGTEVHRLHYEMISDHMLVYTLS